MANRYWVGGSGTWNTTNTANWSATSGGASGASAPGADDPVLIDANSGSGTITLGEDVTVFRVIFTGYTGSFQPSTFAVNAAGSGGTSLWSGGSTATFLATPTVNFTYSGADSRTVTIGSASGFPRNINANITAGSGTFTFTGNTNINNFNCTGFSGSIAASSSNLNLTGNVTLSASMTIGSGTGPIFFAGSGSRTITTNGVFIDRPMGLSAAASGGVVNFADALTQGSTRTFTITAGTLKLKNGVTSTVGAFATSGTEQKFLSSTVAGSQATLSQASGTVNVSNLTIQDINATGGATWNAFTVDRNIVNGNNNGWNFISIFKPIFPRKIVQRDVFKTVF